ncbi:MAG: YitT family protein [Candidatus Riflebacteria bacterium]|nr:YitT family protein [Candidatus Riflebacteria bacterium]
MKNKFTLHSILLICAGVALSVFSQAFFLIPNKIVPSGLVGIGTILFHKFGVPVGTFVIVVNLFLIVIQARMMGLGAGAKTMVAIFLSGFFLDFCTVYLKVQRLASDPMLAAIYGGVLTGLGTACIFKASATLGGTDILAQLLARFKHIPVGTTFLWSDVVVLLFAGFVYGPDLALFALIKSYIVSSTVDNFMEGSSVYRQVLIVSKKSEEIMWGIMEEIHRGVTVLNGRGGYTNRNYDILITAVRRREIPLLEELVYQVDHDAFLVVADARRVLGKGFDNLKREVELVSNSNLDEPDIEDLPKKTQASKSKQLPE